MKRLLVAGLTVAALTAGCGSERTSLLDSLVYPEPGASGEALLPTTMPAELPAAVGAVSVNAASVELAEVYKLPDTEYGPGASSKVVLTYASGINVGDNKVLTAGHIPYDESDTGSVLLPQVATCGNLTVSAPTAKPTARSAQGGQAFDGNTYEVEKVAGSYDKMAYFRDAKMPDRALMQLTPQEIGPQTAPMIIRDTPVTRGERLYFIGFPPEGEHRRTPDDSRLDDAYKDLANGFDKPTIYGGIVASGPDPTRVGKVLVRTGYQSYGAGPFPHTKAIKGNSGELVVDETGRLVGISSEAALGESTEQGIANDFGVDISTDGKSDKDEVSFTLFQPISPLDLADLKAKLGTAPPCKPLQ